MKQPPILLVLFSILWLTTDAQAQYFDARNNAMGGVGVASSHYLVAGFANPAMLTRIKASDDFGILIPNAGISISDPDDLVRSLQDFADQVDIVQGKLNTNTANLADLVGLMNQLNALDGKTATGNLGAGFAFAMPTGSFALSIHAHSYTDFSARTLVDPADTDPTSGRIITALISGNVQNLGSEARILAANVLELGVSVARQFDIAGMSLSIGATPKVQRVDTFNYAINAQNFENLDDFNDAAFRTDEIDFNLDLGVAFSPVEALTIGLVGRNVLAQDYGTVNTFGQAFTYEIQPKLILGAAVKLETLTLAADIDVTGDDRFKDVTLNFSNVLDDDSQFARFGAEFDAWTWAQIRAGYVTDLENTVEDMFTAGIGISPGDVWHLDIAGMYADEHSFGGVVQMSFTF